MNPVRQRPADFEEHAGEKVRDLVLRYRTSNVKIAIWKQEIGIPVKRRPKRPMEQIDPETGKVVATWDSAYYAAKEYFGSPSNILTAAAGYPYRTAYGYRWRFL